MATPTTTLPRATLAALDGEAGNASAGKRLFRNTVWSGIGSAAPMLVAVVAVLRLIRGLVPKMIYLAAAMGVTVVLALPLMKCSPVLVEA